MDIATSVSSHDDSKSAIIDAISQLQKKIAHPKVILVYFSHEYDIDILQFELTRCFPDTQILGCSSCQGFMTDEGYHFGKGIALWGMCDYYGAFGSAIVSTHGSDFDLARQCVLKAIENSGRPGELPALILLHATPGNEETLIKGIESELGSSVPIIGGSAADDFVKGNWKIFTHDQYCKNGIGIMVFYPSCQISYSFHSGYASTGKNAVATKVIGREVIELDHKPAIDVYESWLDLEVNKDNSSMMAESSLHPLGRAVGDIHDIPYFKLSHPKSVTARKGIELFATIEEGERLFFMEGTEERLITRAGRVVELANTLGEFSEMDPIGGITIYCAGCMLRVKQRMTEVSHYVNQSMHHAPFVGPFTFGEQGQFVGGENAHGNLMISAVLFHRNG